MPYKDPIKQKEAQHHYYLNNKEKYDESHRKSIPDFRRRRKQWFYDLKSTKECLKCGEKRVPCLEFHHRDIRNGDDSLRITRFVSGGWSKKRILEEIAKCDVLCRNCHAIEHWDEDSLNFTKLH